MYSNTRTGTNDKCRRQVMALPYCRSSQSMAKRNGLQFVSVTWEDNGRSKNSAVGPAISDMTLRADGVCLPVLRLPNFSDLTWDVTMDAIPLLVGNEHGGALRSTSLRNYLAEFGTYSGNEGTSSLLAENRDSHVIMSSQACFLPMEEGNETTFNVTLKKYHELFSLGESPVLVIVATSKGTSAQIVFSGSQQDLFFNNNGQRTRFVGQRLRDNRRERGVPVDGPMTKKEKQDNVVMVIQVPLKKDKRMEYDYNSQIQGASQPYSPCPPTYTNSSYASSTAGPYCNYSAYSPTYSPTSPSYSLTSPGSSSCPSTYSCNYSPCPPSYSPTSPAYSPPPPAYSPPPSSQRRRRSRSRSRSRSRERAERHCDVEPAIVKLGPSEGAFPSVAGLGLQRDSRFPVRVTLQFYKSTSNGVMSQPIIDGIAAQLTRSRSEADYIGSLVTGGYTGRPTEPELGIQQQTRHPPPVPSPVMMAPLNSGVVFGDDAGAAYNTDPIPTSAPPPPCLQVVAGGIKSLSLGPEAAAAPSVMVEQEDTSCQHDLVGVSCLNYERQQQE